MLRAYKYRLYPNKLQKAIFKRHFDGVRYIYNNFLGMCQKEKKEKGTNYSKKEAQKYLVTLKKTEGWLYEVNAQSLQGAIHNLYIAFANMKKMKAGFPNFKSRKTYSPSFSIPQNLKLDQEKGYINIPKIKDKISTVVHRKFEGEIRTSTISLSKSGKYYISVVVKDGKLTPESKIELDKSNTLGIDVGIIDFVTTSEGVKTSNPKFFVTGGKKLSRVQKQFSRLKKNSIKRRCFRKKVAIVHERITNKRTQYQYEEAKKLWNDNQVEAIAFENLGIKNMMRNSRLAKHIADSSWYKFKTIVKYKMLSIGKKIIESGRFDATSKICNNCKTKNNNLKLHHRIWNCDYCNCLNDRDVNAAKNIRDFALGKLLRKGKPFV